MQALLANKGIAIPDIDTYFNHFRDLPEVMKTTGMHLVIFHYGTVIPAWPKENAVFDGFNTDMERFSPGVLSYNKHNYAAMMKRVKNAELRKVIKCAFQALEQNYPSLRDAPKVTKIGDVHEYAWPGEFSTVINMRGIDNNEQFAKWCRVQDFATPRLRMIIKPDGTRLIHD